MKIFVDYDTTLVNLIDPWVEWINQKYNVNITTTDINRWYYLGEVFGKEADDFWRSEKYNHYTDKDILQPFKGAVEFFHTLQKEFGKENVFIVSSTRDHHKEEKIIHAQHYFGIEKKQFIPVNKEKFHVVTNGILIDDYPLHVLEHIKYNKQKGIVFNYEGRFGWCRECNYSLDQTLDSVLQYTKDSTFHYAISYCEVLSLLRMK
jgi:5'(3')-deoxyribonucleotidase